MKHFTAVAIAGLWMLTGVQQATAEVSGAGAEQVLDRVAATPESDTALQLFGCVMPLPPGYVLRADAEPFFLYRKDGGGNISISPYEVFELSIFEVLREISIGPVTVVKVRARKAYLRNQPTVVFIHDGKVQMIIIGDDEDWADHMARSCSENLIENALDRIAATPESDTALRLFGCVMPLPPGYVLQTDAEPFFLYREKCCGNISIGPYEILESSKFEVLRERSIGPVTVVNVRGRKEYFGTQPTLALVHDGKVQMIILGRDENWASHMAQSCSENLIKR
ncbi:MAG: hypothetical protein OEU09_16930 [Rhodospirillales bacterium]|nr:hypothetical protein [Rhodospirillales bacterium]MDH3793286.1 hypothetical protein [Rhodospirillales bacterium]MDH3912974.1 hypothetical protein [Rhodospirillales bacterium]MDH3917609.1 hypothetical protein [Rhodospirillales bacterium]MDH3969937.1 hypothetical protein [Rhodospirillales bacterium]